MIDISKKKLESLSEDVEKEIISKQKDQNKLKKSLQNCETELTFLRGLKFNIEQILENKN